MYQITDSPCPQCFRLLRIKSLDEGLYCPDTLNCRWESNKPVGRKLPQIPRKALQDGLQQAIAAGQSLKALRIKTLLAR